MAIQFIYNERSATTTESAEHPRAVQNVGELSEFIGSVIIDATRAGENIMMEVVTSESAYDHQILEVGISSDGKRGFVHVASDDGPARLTRGDASSDSTLAIYRFEGRAREVPASHEVPLTIVAEVLEIYLTTDGNIPADCPHLHSAPCADAG
ncbi:Imm1 family immunity protein [Actinosynnema sp. NPDC047251]|uniref:Uncharacterized protein n=1 Tax=Saccharothrix espanaensis (strain ATCC 51144 / DSM 44229 / JCM 9112 / NBRC 15066 / NRRL 15764) TaxID=1179773 RepID=K0JWW8_SACES|nr:Imm1 family immunity protein [Saccharothrix espanaensis]CCH29912.1 hypothetical protein BN6_25990 [Saccharothrix espanaensis DSM 44229]